MASTFDVRCGAPDRVGALRAAGPARVHVKRVPAGARDRVAGGLVPPKHGAGAVHCLAARVAAADGALDEPRGPYLDRVRLRVARYEEWETDMNKKRSEQRMSLP